MIIVEIYNENKTYTIGGIVYNILLSMSVVSKEDRTPYKTIIEHPTEIEYDWALYSLGRIVNEVPEYYSGCTYTEGRPIEEYYEESRKKELELLEKASNDNETN